ncbi:hypothetical protein [Pontibaca methylaminivorans]|uniref:Uncharacterized protein n=1 Tax=Pontibaca methylaminivorans TaxID=515897 RepID=A0A1R3W9Z6_9RHOB|nr:hypothetical protein [Pontibaca methylaminivorans]SIT74825.1 hypothetical protein SAMN05421849_0218 [Pontibaca methylaminivorans]
MALFIRMALYFVLAGAGTVSWLDWDPGTGILSVHVEGLALALPSYAGFIVTFLFSRVAKRRGGQT